MNEVEKVVIRASGSWFEKEDELPEGVLPEEEWGWRRHRVFAYGMLRSPVIVHQLLWRDAIVGPATLPGWERVVGEGGHVTVEPAEGAVTVGVILDVTTPELLRLDHFEAVDQGFYFRDTVEVDGEPAIVYRQVRDE